MNANSDTLGHLAQLWSTWVWSSSWQSALVAGLILVVVARGRRWNAPLRYAMLLVALVKFAMPPLLPVPAGLFSLVAPVARPPIGLPVQADAVSTERFRTGNLGESGSVSHTLSAFPNLETPVPIPDAAQGESVPLALPSKVQWRAVLMLAHLAGAVLVLSWFGMQAFRLAAIRRRAERFTQPAVDEVFAQVLTELAFTRAPELLISAEISSPVAFGIIRPTILLPGTLSTRFTAWELRTVLAHELAHLRRRDLWVNALELVLVACWWFHPCIWALRRALRRTREDCCDDLLLARGLTSSDHYCEVLVRAARELAVGEPNCTALGLGENLHPLARRLRRIMDRTLSRSAKLSLGGAGMTLMTAWLLLPGLRSEERAKAGVPAATAEARTNANNLALAISASSPSLEEWFAKLRWVSEDNLFFEETRRTAQQIGIQAVPFLLGKLNLESSDPDDAAAADAHRKAAMALGFFPSESARTVSKLIEALDDAASVTQHAGPGKLHLIPVRSVAADALGQIGPGASNAIPALTEAAEFGNGAALLALARIAPASPGVLETLTNALHDFTKRNQLPLEGEYRLTALKSLGVAAKNNPSALKAFAGAIDDTDPRFPTAVAAGLVSMRQENPDAGRLLSEQLERGSLRQRTFLASTLAKSGTKSDLVYQILITGLRAQDPEFLAAAIEGLAAFQTRAAEAVPILATVATTATGELRSAAVRALGAIGRDSPQAVDALMQNFNASDEILRAEAVGIVGNLGTAAQKAVPELLELLHHPDPLTRQSAAQSLGQLHASPAKAIPALKAALSDPAYGVASTAMTSLGRFPEAADEMIPVLVQALGKTNAWAAAIALGDFGPKSAQAVPALIGLLTNTGPGVRNNAANALGKIGPAAKPALPALELASRDTDSGVRNNAAMALWKIDQRTNVIALLSERLRSVEAISALERLNLKSTRLWDMRQLSEIGPPATAAIPVLQSYLADPDDDLRSAAQAALTAIESKVSAANPNPLNR